MSNSLPNTRLELLMQLTEVTGKKLANVLGVDMSLISRWKNGKRKLRDNEYTRGIAHYFVDPGNGDYIKAIHFVLKEKAEGKELEELLIQWLLKPFKPEDNPRYYFLESMENGNGVGGNSHIVYRSFLGDKGRREAIINLLKILSNIEQPRRLYIYSNEDFKWLYEEKSQIKIWSKSIIELLKKGYEIHIIHNNETQSIGDLVKFIIALVPLYLTGKVYSYRVENMPNHNHWDTMYIAEDLYSVCSYSLNNSVSNRYTLMTNDNIAIQSFMIEYQHILEQSKVLNQFQTGKDLPNFFSNFTQVGKHIEGSFFKSDELFYSNMSSELLDEVLQSNHIGQKNRGRTLAFHAQLNNNFQNNIKAFGNKHIYDLSALVEKVGMKTHKCYHLSMIVGEDVFLTKEQYIGLIKGAIHRLEKNDHFQIGLYIPDRTFLPLSKVNFWVKDSYFVTFWTMDSHKHITMFSDPTMVEACIQLYNNIWNSIPYIDCEKEHIINHFNKLIKIGEAGQ